MTLAPPSLGTYTTYMGRREDAVRQALESFPGSIRTLASAAGVSEGLLRAIRDGRRTATPRVVGMIADALSDMAEHQVVTARIFRDAISGEEA